MSVRSGRIWTNPHSIHRSNWKWILRTKRTQRKVQERFRSMWRMVRRSLIQQIQAEYWIRFSIQTTTNLNTSVWIWHLGRWMLILFVNQQITGLQATQIQIQACLEPKFRCPGFGYYGSLWTDLFEKLICQEHRWRMKWVLAGPTPRLQWQWFANWWLRTLWWGCHCSFYEGIPNLSGKYLNTTTFLALLVMNGSGIRTRDCVLCPATCWRFREHHLMGIQRLYQPLNQFWWLQCPERQRPSRLSSTR